MAQLPICQLEKEQKFEGFLLVRTADQRTGGNGAKYLDLNLTDRTGEVNAKVWDGNVPCPMPGTVVKVRGTTLEYNGRLQLRVERIRSAGDGDPVDLSLLAPCAPENPETMFQELKETALAMTSVPLRRITLEMLEQFREKLLYYPAAQKIHHAERAGLLHHTTGMLRLAKLIVEQYAFLNRDLLFAGVILHDLCKTEEMDSSDMGVVKDYSLEGLLLGHLALGVTRIQEAANRLGISGEPVLMLQHMMLSHHGEPEFGSPRKPMFPEAEALHWVDMLDARMNEMQGAIAKIRPGVFSEKIWSLDRRLYHVKYEDLSGENKVNP